MIPKWIRFLWVHSLQCIETRFWSMRLLRSPLSGMNWALGEANEFGVHNINSLAQDSGQSASVVHLQVSVSLPGDKLGICTGTCAIDMGARHSTHIHRTFKLHLSTILSKAVHLPPTERFWCLLILTIEQDLGFQPQELHRRWVYPCTLHHNAGSRYPGHHSNYHAHFGWGLRKREKRDYCRLYDGCCRCGFWDSFLMSKL